ncbi:aminoglycoside phosphotransferase [Virgibacillus phasianinus]|uniref:Aminoglycoside phosphotransferase n=1 Tax=Virgibacillus phasianinus TaxID=2017483 RepID=A0A220TZF4_9BACI|nr:aminoglycoside phosphotransferase family protein [Virgibacillus phasianinus]ASK61013.1 aminoglycoside phosphotransferase [Virgibacillus phasianinus]
MFISYADRIKQVYPELMINDIQLNEIGQNNDVLIVDHAIVFHFPKYTQGVEQLREETVILEHINKYVTLPIPVPIYQSFDVFEVSKVFTGYKLIPGTPLWRNDFEKITDDQQVEKIAAQLVEFLIELHGISIEEVKKILPKQTFNLQLKFVDLYKKIQGKLYPYMREEARKDVTALFGDFFSQVNDFTFKPLLIHGDFGASNILYDSCKREITGIIDFGGSELGDPAYDFAGILASYGEAFFKKCISLYPNGTEIAKRTYFYKGTFALQEALHGIENGDKDAFESGMKDYL